MKYHVNYKNGIVRKYTIKEILRENWLEFTKSMAAEGKPIRFSITKNVNRIIDCQDPKKGYSLYICEKCSAFKQVYFTCKSRFCNTCGAKYSKDRALFISAKLIDCSHRHVVFTIPTELRKYFAHRPRQFHRILQNDYKGQERTSSKKASLRRQRNIFLRMDTFLHVDAM